jgi:hypothetical protein
MKVRELIDLLKTFDSSLDVVVYDVAGTGGLEAPVITQMTDRNGRNPCVFIQSPGDYAMAEQMSRELR